MWTEVTRAQYQRGGLRYASDMTDGEWGLIAPLLPAPARLGRPRTVALRAVVDALLYIASTACQWRALPKDYPARSTVQGYFYRWRDAHLWQRIVDTLVVVSRAQAGRMSAPTLGIIDSQSAATTESGGPRGFDMGKKVKGRKRHIVTDTRGHLLAVQVHGAGIQDCHGAAPLLRLLRQRFPSVERVLADRVYRGDQLRAALGRDAPVVEIIERPPGTRGFLPLPQRWVVERTFAWLGRCRRLAKDFEASAESQIAWILIAHFRTLSRRIARHHAQMDDF